MLFDLFDVPKEKEYNYWVRRLHSVSSILQYDYFKLWELPEHEFNLLESFAQEEIEFRKNQKEELKKLNNK